MGSASTVLILSCVPIAQNKHSSCEAHRSMHSAPSTAARFAPLWTTRVVTKPSQRSNS